MKNKSVKVGLVDIGIKDGCGQPVLMDEVGIFDGIDPRSDSHKILEARFKKDENKLPPMILDDDIADWEHDNLVK